MFKVLNWFRQSLSDSPSGRRSPEPEHHKPGSGVPYFFLLRSLRLYITYARERLVIKLCL